MACWCFDGEDWKVDLETDEPTYYKAKSIGGTRWSSGLRKGPNYIVKGFASITIRGSHLDNNLSCQELYWHWQWYRSQITHCSPRHAPPPTCPPTPLPINPINNPINPTSETCTYPYEVRGTRTCIHAAQHVAWRGVMWHIMTWHVIPKHMWSAGLWRRQVLTRASHSTCACMEDGRTIGVQSVV